MSGFKGLIHGGLKVALAYKFSFFVGLIRTPINMIVFYFLWTSIFAFSGVATIKGFTLQEMISYYVLSMIVGILAWSSVDEWIEEDVREGRMVGTLTRPVDYFGWQFYFQLGLYLLSLVIEIVPITLLGLIFFGLHIAQPFLIFAFIVSSLLALYIVFSLAFLIGMLAFWMQKIQGIRRARRMVFAFLNGALIPLTFFPVWLQTILKFSPFPYMRFVPVNIYLAKYAVAEIWMMLGIQLVWCILLYGLYKLIWARAFKHFAGVGT